MAGAYSQRILSRANRAVTRMQSRMKRIEDAFAVHSIFGPNGEIDFDAFFAEADKCGHKYGEEACDCSLCEQIRPKLIQIMQQMMQPSPQGG